jgi:hypothetical protein
MLVLVTVQGWLAMQVDLIKTVQPLLSACLAYLVFGIL